MRCPHSRVTLLEEVVECLGRRVDLGCDIGCRSSHVYGSILGCCSSCAVMRSPGNQRGGRVAEKRSCEAPIPVAHCLLLTLIACAVVLLKQI